MSTPTRWHKPSCDTPQVLVDGDVPECRTCGSNASALLRRAAEEPAPSYSGVKLPPEAPIGQMDLWWPPCVPYTRDGAPRAQPGASSGDAASLTPGASDSSLSEIYTTTLGRDHFRLLYLSGSRNIDSPIHGDLVEYQQGNSPEYETTSYTWGGEDGDATPCKPAYFGRFWDVLFLTRNCWSLIQYLRPQIGSRAVWVDAICINQNNTQERGAQVSTMPQIYRNCMRVVIYPGNHLVRKDGRRFRQRIRYDHIYSVHDSIIDILAPVFQSRYISHVWIIQELILAPHAILALKNYDLYLGNGVLHYVSQKAGRIDWLEIMGQDYRWGRTTLYEGLRKTLGSQATDQRDKIFGILGILGANPTYSKIVPDYSLSMRDCLIGAIGLTLITSKEIWPLLHAPPSDTTSGYPSWVPSLDEMATRRGETSVSLNDEFSPMGTELATHYGWRPIEPKKWTTAICLQEIHRNHGTTFHAEHAHGLGHMKPDSESLLVGSGISWCQDASIDSRSGALTLRLKRLFDKPYKIVEQSKLWGQSYFLFEGLSTAAWLGSRKLPKKPEQPCHMFLAYPDQTPDLEMWPHTGSSHLRTFDIHLMFASEAEASGTFKLVGCCVLNDAVFLSASPPPSPPLPLSSDASRCGSARSLLSLSETLHQTLKFYTRKCSPLDFEYDSSRFEDCHKWENFIFSASEVMLFDMIVPGNGASASSFLQLALSAARMEEPATVTEEFTQAYATCLQAASAEFNPVLDDEYVWFTLVDNDCLSHYWDSLMKHFSEMNSDLLSYDEQVIVQEPHTPWNKLFPPWFDLQIPDIGQTLFDGSKCDKAILFGREGAGHMAPNAVRCAQHQDYDRWGHTSLHYWLPCATEPRELKMPVRAVLPLIDVVKAIRATKLNRLHRHLVAFSEKVSEDVEALLSRGPQPRDSNIYLQDWPKSLVDELGFVWRNEMVTFV